MKLKKWGIVNIYVYSTYPHVYVVMLKKSFNIKTYDIFRCIYSYILTNLQIHRRYLMHLVAAGVPIR